VNGLIHTFEQISQGVTLSRDEGMAQGLYESLITTGLGLLVAIPGYLFRTNLGYSLDTFFTNHLDAVTGRSTVILIGDGRNNYSDPRLDLVKDLNRRAKKLVWFTPENKQLWGTGDSDMDRYAELCDEVYLVRNLAQLSNAIDRVFVD